MILRKHQVTVQHQSSPGWGQVDTSRYGDAGGPTPFVAAASSG